MRPRNRTASSAVHAVSGGRLFRALSLAVALALCSAANAQPGTSLPVLSSGAAGPGGQATSASPVVAEVTGSNVQIRSDAGTQFYPCGNLNKGDRVQVVKAQGGWSAILPPPGTYSWIAVRYVSTSIQNPTEGVVTGNDAPVYAGSDDLDPLVSTTKQGVTMSRGQKVRLLNEEKNEYYKIAPPAGAYLWVSSQYLQPVGGAGMSLPSDVARGGAQPAVNQGPTTPNAAPTETSLLAQYNTLKTQIEQEQKKPLDQQDFSAMKEKLKTLADNKDGGRAARYAQYTLKQVERFELARTAGKELELQNQDIKESSEKIDKALQKRLQDINDPGKYAVVGKIQPSILYSRTVAGQAQRFQLIDDSGKILCYVSPAGAAAGKDLTPFIGHKVGLVGQILPHAPTARAFVEFSDIVRLD